jgi:hypothetical protein
MKKLSDWKVIVIALVIAYSVGILTYKFILSVHDIFCCREQPVATATLLPPTTDVTKQRGTISVYLVDCTTKEIKQKIDTCNTPDKQKIGAAPKK